MRVLSLLTVLSVLTFPAFGSTPSECLLAIVQEAITRPISGEVTLEQELQGLEESAKELSSERRTRVSSWIMRSLNAVVSRTLGQSNTEKPMLTYRHFYEYETGETRAHPCAGEFDCPEAEAVTAWAEESRGFWRSPDGFNSFVQAAKQGEPFNVVDEKEIWPALEELHEKLQSEDPKGKSHLARSLNAIRHTMGRRNGGNYQWYYGGAYSWPGPNVPYFVHFTLPYEDGNDQRVIEVLFVTRSKKGGTFYLMDRRSK